MKWNQYLKLITTITLIFALTNPAHTKIEALDQTELSLIVEVEGNPYEWKEYIEKYHPFIEVVYVYDTLLNALALKGHAKDLFDIDKEDFIKTVHPTQTYKVPTKIESFHGTSESATTVEPPSRDFYSKYTGEGVKVGVIDTGVDHTHPDLQKNYKGGYDVVDFDDDPMETLPEQGPPTLHGTHVSGIIAANGEMKGVAPNADLYVYRALGPGGMGTSVGIIAALEKAVEDDMDIVNLSLGSTVNSPDWPTSLAVNRAIDMGVAVVIANGNEGPGNWTVSSPATSVKALSVGASIKEMKQAFLSMPIEDRQIPLAVMSGSIEWTLQKDYQLIDGKLGKTPITDARGKIVLMERGEIPFTEKAKQAEQAGAVAVLIYNNEEGELSGGLTAPLSIPVAGISKEDGEWLLNQMAENNKWVSTNYKKIENKLAAFSSKGPVVTNWDIKPEILAPGVEIASTVPNDGYQKLQGTSMAAPYVAGVLALIKEAHPNWGPDKLKAAVLSTAKPFHDETGKRYDPIAQGMGEIQVKKSINPEVLIYGSRLTFGKITPETREKKMDIVMENLTNKEKKFTFDYPDHQPGIQWHIPQTFYLGPKERKAITVELRVNSGNLQKGVHQGWITLYNGKDAIHLPYLFLNQTADYPKIDGLELTFSPFEKDKYHYKMYLPDGADVLTIDLYEPGTLRYVRTILDRENIKPGMLEGVLTKRELGKQGAYIAVVKVQNGNELNSIVTDFQIM